MLAYLLSSVDGNAIDLRALNQPRQPGHELTEAAKMQNLTLIVNAAAGIGCSVPGLRPLQLLHAESNDQVAYQQVWSIIRLGLLNQISVKLAVHPNLPTLQDAPVEQVLVHWLNLQVCTLALMVTKQAWMYQYTQSCMRENGKVACARTVKWHAVNAF